MTEKEYYELNRYLSIIFEQLKVNDAFFIHNLENIGYLSGVIYNLVSKYDLVDKFFCVYLSDNDLFLLVGEIIKSISEEYYKQYQEIVKNKKIHISYTDGRCSAFYTYNVEDKTFDFYLNRSFTLEDALALVHEFIHSTNNHFDKNKINRYLFSEFLSLRFEFYAVDYLQKTKDFSNEQVNFNHRISYLISNISKLNEYIFPFIAFKNFGKVDQNSCRLLFERNIIDIDEEYFEEKCKKLLKKIKKNDSKIFENKCRNLFGNHYQYIMGILLAFYDREIGSIENMIYFNNHINDSNFSSISFLRQIGIDLNSLSIMNQLVKSVKNILRDEEKTRDYV